MKGRADLVYGPGDDDAWRDLYRRIALRYVPEAWADAYLQDTIDEPRALYSVDLGRSNVTTEWNGGLVITPSVER